PLPLLYSSLMSFTLKIKLRAARCHSEAHINHPYFWINLVLPDILEMEEKNLRFFSSISRISGKTRFIQLSATFGTTHNVFTITTRNSYLFFGAGEDGAPGSSTTLILCPQEVIQGMKPGVILIETFCTCWMFLRFWVASGIRLPATRLRTCSAVRLGMVCTAAV